MTETTGGLLLGGRLVPSQSGRTYPVSDHHGGPLGTASLANRRDVRDAVALARDAAPGWAALAPWHRADLLLWAEDALGARHDELTEAVASAEGAPTRRAGALVDQSRARWVYYAGWADKLRFATEQTPPKPAGVVAVLAPQRSSLLGLVSVLAPVLAAGSTAVLVAAQDRPLPALALVDALLAAQLPAGSVSVLTGRTAELAPWLAAHPEVDAVDLCGAPAALREDLELAAAGTAKRVLPAPSVEPDWSRPPSLRRLRSALRVGASGG